MNADAPAWLVGLGDLALALGLLLLSLAIGVTLLGRLACRPDRALEQLCLGTAVGAAALSTGLLALGALAGFRPWMLAAALLAALAASHAGARAIPHILSGSARALRSAGALPLAIGATVGAAVVIQALAPPVDWDSLMYHLRVPAQWLQAGRVYLPQDNLHAALAQLVHVLYVPLLAFGSPSAPGVLSALFALLLSCAAFAFAQRFLHPETARFTPALLWGSTLLAVVAATPRVDVTLALYLFLAQYALWLARTKSSEPRFLDLAALLLGFSFGVKHHALAFAAALGPVVLWVTMTAPGPAGGRARALARFATVWLIGALPWLLKNLALFGSPLYPVLSTRRMEPWLASLYAAGGLPTRFPEVMPDFLSQVREPVNLLDLFFAPGLLSIELEAGTYFLNALLLALPLWALFRRDSTLNALGLPALAYVVLLLLVAPTTNPRYLIPALIPLTLVATEVVVRAAARHARPRFVHALLWILTLAAVWPTARTLVRELAAGRTLAYVSGRVARSDYLPRHREREVFAYGQMVSFLNGALRPGSRVLMILEARGFYLEGDVLQDNLLTNWPLVARLVAEGRCLQSSAITHVLVNHSALNYYVHRGLDRRALAWLEFDRFRERCLVLDHAGYGFSLYRLRR